MAESIFNFIAWDRKHYEEVAKGDHAIVRQTMMNVNTNRSNQNLEKEYLKAVLPYQIKTGILGEENSTKERYSFLHAYNLEHPGFSPAYTLVRSPTFNWITDSGFWLHIISDTNQV